MVLTNSRPTIYYSLSKSEYADVVQVLIGDFPEPRVHVKILQFLQAHAFQSASATAGVYLDNISWLRLHYSEAGINQTRGNVLEITLCKKI
ncbi:MAG: hypothetical protein ACRCZZ_00630 [Phocaeicola sp.]